ncbi:MAG: DUF362 domain-containing protein [bacterium]|nr:DUF362 domain-containing protein [bacterium]
MILPSMVKIKQNLDVDYVCDVGEETKVILDNSGLLARIEKNSRVAIGVGSRGIANLYEVVDTLCKAIKEIGAVPFLFPAMGSHGGGTSQGQIDVLNSLGINGDSLGVEILSDAEGLLKGETLEGIPVYIDRHALEADYVVVINRIKLHTKFKGPVESGISKMLSIGTGKKEGATALHRCAVKIGFSRIIQAVAQKTMENINFLFGIALIESPEKKLHSISLLTPETIEEEQDLLKNASQIMPRIPIDKIDLLIIDEIGKDISGTGMDTNVTGRNRDIIGDFCMLPEVLRIFVRDLTKKTGGNANGIGFADFTTRRLVDSIDYKKTYTNALAAMSPEKAAIPVTMENDRDAITASLESIGLESGEEAAVVRIKNTSELCDIEISEALLQTIKDNSKITIVEQAKPMSFDKTGNLLPLQ